MYDLIREIENESKNLELDDLGGVCFNSDIYSLKHRIKTCCPLSTSTPVAESVKE